MAAPDSATREASRAVHLDETIATRAAMHRLGRRLAATLRAGDLVVLTGDLGAGKTTLTQGIGAGLGVRGQVTSPTFVIARVHPNEADGVPLVHVDAYRLGAIGEVDDLDLDASLDESVTVVEWGAGLVDGLSSARLEVSVHRPRGALPGPDGDRADEPDVGDDVADDEPRRVVVTGVGERWSGVEIEPDEEA